MHTPLPESLLRPYEVGGIAVDVPVVLAPMSGISDMPFRLMCKRYGAGLVVSEMQACEAVVRDSVIAKQKAAYDKRQGINVVQIVGANPQNMAAAAVVNEKAGADIIDINMGCPVKKVVNTLSGSALLKDKNLVRDILTAVVQAVNVPVTLKMRTGWSEAIRNGPEIAMLAEECGIKQIAIHGRTRCQMYNGKADWDFIHQMQSKVSIPVLANGDVTTLDDAVNILRASGANGVMIGRACQGRPWFLGQVARYLQTGEIVPDPSVEEQYEIVCEHYDMALQFYGEDRGLRLMRKHLSWYAKGFADGAAYRRAVNQLDNAADVRRLTKEFYDTCIRSGAVYSNPHLNESQRAALH